MLRARLSSPWRHPDCGSQSEPTCDAIFYLSMVVMSSNRTGLLSVLWCNTLAQILVHQRAPQIHSVAVVGRSRRFVPIHLYNRNPR